MNSKELTDFILCKMEEKEITPKELSIRAGISLRIFYFWKDGKRKISLDTADKLLRIIGETVTLGDSQQKGE